jgi:RNA polymerase sigma factor (sigma-70 family)
LKESKKPKSEVYEPQASNPGKVWGNKLKPKMAVRRKRYRYPPTFPSGRDFIAEMHRKSQPAQKEERTYYEKAPIWDDQEEQYCSQDIIYKLMASALLPAALSTLTRRQREAFKMRYEASLSVPEIAEIQGVTRQAVNQRLIRAAERLKQFNEKRLPNVYRFPKGKEE